MTLAFEAMGQDIILKPKALPAGLEFLPEEKRARLFRQKKQKGKKLKEEPIDFEIEEFIPKRAEKIELLKLLIEEEEKEEDIEVPEDLSESALLQREEKKEEQRQLREKQKEKWETQVEQGWPELKGYLFVNFPKNEEDVNLLKKMGVSFDRVVQLDVDDSESDDFEFSEDVKRLHTNRNDVVNYLLLSKKLKHSSSLIFNSKKFEY